MHMWLKQQFHTSPWARFFKYELSLSPAHVQGSPGCPVSHPILLQAHADDTCRPDWEAVELQHIRKGSRVGGSRTPVSSIPWLLWLIHLNEHSLSCFWCNKGDATLALYIESNRIAFATPWQQYVILKMCSGIVQKQGRKDRRCHKPWARKVINVSICMSAERKLKGGCDHT